MNIWQMIQHKVPALTQHITSPDKTRISLEKNINDAVAPVPQPKAMSAAAQTTQERIHHEKLQMMIGGLSDKETTLQTLVRVEESLKKVVQPTQEQVKLLEVIQKMQEPTTLHTKVESMQFIRQAVSLLGLDFEKGLSDLFRHGQPLSEGKLEQVKPLLMSYLQQAESMEEKAVISQLISKLTGFQLLTREEGNLHHVFLPLPINLENETKEWYVHVSSKKKNESLDPEYCRIVLLLDLPIFSSVMVDVLVQGKVVNISFHHTYPALEGLVQKSSPLLKHKLSAKGYTLSKLKTDWKKAEQASDMATDFLRTILSPSQEGMDIRI